ncbi:MAG: polyprenyl synthetase family protein [Sedimentisphaerales bacterium]|nr:polyprenyl synthetase family protein [Sedimentisphaerales bacterium]
MHEADFKKELGNKAVQVNEVLRRLIDKQPNLNSDIKKAIEYTMYAAGKRIRGALVLWCCEVVSGDIDHNAEIAAAAIEMVHTYSLIHDDLPAMDDDDIRRGQPTCHKAFDEATAVLTGDALLTFAFEIVAKEIDDTDIAIKVISQLAESAGPAGMIAGQMADLKAESQKPDIETLEYIHQNKTAKMFQCSAVCGGIAGGADTKQLRCLWNYGLNLGLAFQVADDILDICSSAEQTGKTSGKDQKSQKCTYPAVLGLKKSRKIEKEFADKAVKALAYFGPEADILRQLPIALLQRVK